MLLVNTEVGGVFVSLLLTYTRCTSGMYNTLIPSIFTAFLILNLCTEFDWLLVTSHSLEYEWTCIFFCYRNVVIQHVLIKKIYSYVLLCIYDENYKLEIHAICGQMVQAEASQNSV
jgi:hypothetical protein